MLQNKQQRGSVVRVPAHEIETLVADALRQTKKGQHLQLADYDLIASQLQQVIIHADRLEITINEHEAVIDIPWRPTAQQRRREVLIPGGAEDKLRPMKAQDRIRVLKAIAAARIWLEGLITGTLASTEVIAAREQCSEGSIRMTLSLAFLSPRIVKAIIAGQLPRGIGVARLADLPAAWAEQHSALGL